MLKHIFPRWEIESTDTNVWSASYPVINPDPSAPDMWLDIVWKKDKIELVNSEFHIKIPIAKTEELDPQGFAQLVKEKMGRNSVGKALLSRKAAQAKSYKMALDLKYKDGTVTPRGTEVQVAYIHRSPKISKLILPDGTEKRVGAFTLDKYLKGYPKAPSLSQIQIWDDDGYCKTPTGYRVEPDGYGPDNSPSWQLLIGMI